MPTQSRTHRLDTFIVAATTKHGGKYDYSRVPTEYVNAHTKVTIGCPDHGTFTQEPNEHKRGHRCPDCSGRRNSRPTSRRDLFIRHAQHLHGSRYDYSAVQYFDQHTPVVIGCPLHGPFSQRPMNHLSSHTPSNCPTCANEDRAAKAKESWKRRTNRRKRRSLGTREATA